jgi:D-sedoheptulose 7-phosphate isomerase
LLGRFERERPGLAAMALGSDGTAMLAGLGTVEAALARQVETLGQPGDLLLLIDGGSAGAGLRPAAQAAQGKDMTVIALTGHDSGHSVDAGDPWRGLLGETDVRVAVPHERPARVLEAQLLVLHCLCDAIDLQLLGELQDPA